MSGGQPACLGNGRCVERRMNSNTSVMYIRVCHVSCNVVVMFTCILVWSHPDSRRRWGETWTVAINSKIPGWAWQQDACSLGEARMGLSLSPGTRPRRTYLWGASRRPLFKYVQYSNYNAFVVFYLDVFTYHVSIPALRIWFVILIGVFFCRLKINHDTHEFILESGTVVNNNSQQLKF